MVEGLSLASVAVSRGVGKSVLRLRPSPFVPSLQLDRGVGKSLPALICVILECPLYYFYSVFPPSATPLSTHLRRHDHTSLVFHG